jgi:hypothetical protein
MALWHRNTVWFLLIAFGAAAAGCSGCDRKITSKGAKEAKTDTPFDLARDYYTAANFRPANEQANKHLASHADALSRHQPGTKDRDQIRALLQGEPGVDKLEGAKLYRCFLEKFVGLDEKEIDEVESDTFTLLDAQYLEGCHLLQQIHRSLPLQGLSPLEQARYCFRWVCRHVLLFEGQPGLLPPQYVLKAGQGNAAERAFVLVELLRQADVDACVIAVPGKDGLPKPWLVGVLASSAERQDVFLFDLRLGLELPGPQRRGIATLAELRKDPSLLDAFKVPGDELQYDVDAQQVAKAELLLVLPLSGLSARIRFLEDEMLMGFNRVNVEIRAAQIAEKFTKLNLGPVHAWNPPAQKGKTPPPSPTRALRISLPPEEGGIESSSRPSAVAQKSNPAAGKLLDEMRVPEAAFLQGFAELKLSPMNLPYQNAQEQLMGRARQIWVNYAQWPAQQLLRGRLEDCARRLRRIDDALDNIEPMNDQTIAAWREKVIALYKQQSEKDQAEFWNRDQWLAQFLDNPDEESPKQLTKSLLSSIIVRAVSSPMQFESARAKALKWHEEADRSTAKALAAGRADSSDMSAWMNAGIFWGQVVADKEVPLSAEVVKDNYQIINDYAKSSRNLAALLAFSALDYSEGLLRKSAVARLQLATALEQTGKKEAAANILGELRDKLATVQKSAEIASIRQQVKSLPLQTLPADIRAKIDWIFADVAPSGTLYWLRYSAAVRHEWLK